MNTLKTEGDPLTNTNINANKKNNIKNNNSTKNLDVKEKIKPISMSKNKRENIFSKIEKKK